MGDKTKLALPDSNIKIEQGSNLVMINPKLIKKLALKTWSISTLVSYCLGMSVTNGDSIELESWVKFWVKVLEICQYMWAFIIPKNNSNVSLL